MSIFEEASQKIKSNLKPYLRKAEPILIYFISAFFCLFYAGLFFTFYDGINPLAFSNYLMLFGSFIASVFSVVFIITANPIYSIISISAFIGNCLCELIIGSLYYPSMMGIFTGYVHHIVYIILFIFAANTIEYAAVYNLVGLCEVPSFFLAAKRIWKINDFSYDVVSAVSFLLFRIILWIFVWTISFFIEGATAIEKIFGLFLSVGAGYLHINWFQTMINKLWTSSYTQW